MKKHDLPNYKKGRNAFILECMQNNRNLYNTDAQYLANQSRLLESKIKSLQSPKRTMPKRTAMITDEEIDKILEKQDKKNSQNKDIPKEAVVRPSIKSRIKNMFSKQ